MDINSVKEFLQFISNKSQSGNTFTIPEFNLAAERAQMELFENLYQKFEQSQEITDSMHEFLVSVLLNVDQTTGQADYPSDYIHSASLRVIYYKDNVSTERMIKQVKNADWANTLSSTIVMPTLKRAKMTYYNDYMQFMPKNIGIVKLDYFKQPISPKWAYTMVNNRPVYDPVNSVNFQFPDNVHNELVFAMASYLGINLREQELVQYSELQKQEQKLN